MTIKSQLLDFAVSIIAVAGCAFGTCKSSADIPICSALRLLLKQDRAQRLFSRYPIRPCSREYWRTFEGALAHRPFSRISDSYLYGRIVLRFELVASI
jgi:hypothetical protein